MEESRRAEERGLPEALRAAIERTLETTAGSGTRERAQELLDEAARRGQEAREAMSRRGQEAREASGAVTARITEALQEMRLARAEDLEALEARIRSLEERISDLEDTVGPANRQPKG